MLRYQGWLDTPDKVNLINLPGRHGETVPLQAHGGLMSYFCISVMTPQGLVMHTTVPSRQKTN